MAIDLNFIAHQLERLTADVTGMRDDMRVQSAMIMRLDAMIARQDSTLAAVLHELRETRIQIALLKLETD